MIIEKEKVEVETSGVQGTNTFNISCNTEMFEMLSSGVYKDKIKAVIRELSTNARDAHIEADITKNFKVTLPTSLEPNFSVRDFGGGMSEEMIMELYTTYGESTKRMSNAFNGALGIGSKSPFSYTDAFSVVSRNGGRVKTYSLYVDNGMPTISKMADQPFGEGEEEGLEIIVPVEEADYNNFLSTATKVYQWFEQRPDTNLDMSYKEMERPLEGKGWYLYDDSHSTYYETMRGVYVVMANIAYPVDASSLESKVQKTMGQLNVILDVPTGSVRMAASRESLSMTKETIAFLNTRLLEVQAEVLQQVKDKLSEEGTLTPWQESLFLLRMREDYNLAEVMGEEFQGKLDNFKAVGHYAIACTKFPRYGKAEKLWNSIEVEPKKSTNFVMQKKNYTPAKQATRGSNSRGTSYYFTRAVGATWEEFDAAMVTMKEELGSPTFEELENIGVYEKIKTVREKRDPSDTTPRVKLTDRELRLTKLCTGYSSVLWLKASEIDADEEVSKVVVIPANSSYLADKNWMPYSTKSQYDNDGYKNHKGDDVALDITNLMEESPEVIFGNWVNKGITFLVVNKSERSVLKWSNKFVNIHTWIKELKTIPRTVAHKDLKYLADFLDVPRTFCFNHNNYLLGRESTFIELNKWYEENCILPAGTDRYLSRLQKIFPDIAFKDKAIKPKGFSLNRLKQKYRLYPYISGEEGQRMYFKEITKTYVEKEPKED